MAAFAFTSLPLSPLNAQTSASAPDQFGGGLVIDVLSEPPEPKPDPLDIQYCEDEADAGRIAGEIVVCRSLGERTDGSYNHEDWKRRYAQRTQGIKTPDVDGSGLRPGMTPLVTIRTCLIGPCPGEPVLMIDIEALPEAPPGSDADRIGQGLRPLGYEGEVSRKSISEEELGLPPVPDFSAP